jgi:hypothetical protein
VKRSEVKALYLILCCTLINQFPIDKWISREKIKHLKCMFMHFSDNSAKYVNWIAIHFNVFSEEEDT